VIEEPHHPLTVTSSFGGKAMADSDQLDVAGATKNGS
jgi:hypothetical protein